MRAPALGLALLLLACDAGVRLGDACEYTSECTSPSVCALGRCRAECRENRDCPLGARCLLDARGGTCALPDDPDCRDPGETCPGPLACIGGECVNACESVAECPSDAICAPAPDGRARCVRSDVDSGVPTDDAAIDGGIDAEIDAGPGACSLGPRCVLMIAASSYATCALTEGGAVWCWGLGALGSGATPLADCEGTCTATPVRVRHQATTGGETDLQGAARIAGGGLTMCALLGTGEPVCWGPTFDGQTGTGSSDGSIARHVRGVGGASYLDHVVSLRGGDGFWLAIRDVDPLTVGWGHADHDVLLDGAGPGFRATPVEVALVAPSGAAGGLDHACAIVGGELRCWGSNLAGQAGAPAGPADVAPPALVEGLTTPHTFALTRYGGCALEGDDALCWGNRMTLGGNAPMPGCDCDHRARPVVRPSGTSFRALTSTPSGETILAIDAEGDVWCWGINDHRQCQREMDYDVAIPIVRGGLPGPATQIALGIGHGCALVGGVPWCWGNNEHGQTGRPPSPLELDPVPVTIPE